MRNSDREAKQVCCDRNVLAGGIKLTLKCDLYKNAAMCGNEYHQDVEQLLASIIYVCRRRMRLPKSVHLFDRTILKIP